MPEAATGVSGAVDTWPLSARDAAVALGISERTVRRAISRGDLVADKHGGVYRIDPADLACFGRSDRAPANARHMSPGSRDESTGVPTLPGNLADVLSAIHALTGPGFCLAAQGDGQSARDRQRALLSIVQWLCGCALVAGLRSDIGQEQRLPGRMFLLEATFDTAQENSAVGGYLSDGPRVALTQREIDVLQLVALGESNREIADSLFISTPTVKRHLTNILGKLGASSRHEAVLFARSHGHG